MSNSTFLSEQFHRCRSRDTLLGVWTSEAKWLSGYFVVQLCIYTYLVSSSHDLIILTLLEAYGET
ncbi:uncharacterized protein DS421_9g263390 [Arachis hypogaea]|nr:uncharacterized protein DS421_9g263390 [Arachis hypogaea]